MTSTQVKFTGIDDLPGIISETKRWYIFPEIRTVTNKGQKRFWLIKVCVVDTEKPKKVKITDAMINNEKLPAKYEAVYCTESGVIGSKITTSDPTIINEGKNIGKSNETNVFIQALSEAFSVYRERLNASDEKVLPRPMLATDYNSLKKEPDWPLYLQRKYDGDRLLSYVENKELDFYSRNMKTFELIPDSIKDGVVKLYVAARKYYKKMKRPQDEALSLVFDGELYAHGYSLQKHGSFRKKASKLIDVENTDIGKDAKYMIYDVIDQLDPDILYHDRKKILDGIFAIAGEQSKVVNVETFVVTDFDVASEYVTKFISDGYEGGILRVPNSIYKQSRNNYHCKYLLKIKPRYDAEYEIVGFSGGESKGKEAGAIMIICETDDGNEFTVRPALPFNVRVNLFDKCSDNISYFNRKLKGKLIKVYYDALSEDNIPLRATTKLEVRVDK